MRRWPDHRRTLLALRSKFAALSCLIAATTTAPVVFASPPPDGDDTIAPWHFRDETRPVKVVLIAGSVGAKMRDSYLDQVRGMCRNIETKNLAKAGLGAWALRKRFREGVLENRKVKTSNASHEYWLMFGGGLNSVAMPEQTNNYVRRMFMEGHAKGWKVVGMTLNPWGHATSSKWEGPLGLMRHRWTNTIVDFMMKRSTPEAALGRYRNERPDPDAPWRPEELPDISIDVYDSALRDAGAPLRDIAKQRKLLEGDNTWQRAHRNLSAAEREAALDADAALTAQIPRWHMLDEFHSFDSTHPNTEGHTIIAEVMCPELPESWGCDCPEPPRTTMQRSGMQPRLEVWRVQGRPDLRPELLPP